MQLPADIFSLTGPVVLFPVRHHSPIAALLVSRVIETLKPKAVLIEGPSDFNDRLHELDLPHELPIAIYSYVRLGDDSRRGGYYPFCVYSPEWQAFRAARAIGAQVEFIDLPYGDIARDDDVTNRYNDADFRRSHYVKSLCRKLGVDSFDTAWDTLFELDRNLSPQSYLERAHRFCGQMRMIEHGSRLVDRIREAFMADRIREALRIHGEPALVVTGGYHSLALHARLCGSDDKCLTEPASVALTPATEGEERGIAITPYSYERLDSLTGYNSGMPNPGYYHQLWQDRTAGKAVSHRKLLFHVAKSLRDRKQTVSSADLIAAESCATALASLRGHAEIWRTDLVDGLIGSLIKDDLAAGGSHPLLEAVHEVFRGNARGSLAQGALLPPLVRDLKFVLDQEHLIPEPQSRFVELDLTNPADRGKSQLLHRIAILEIRGFALTDGTDFVNRTDLSRLWEKWKLVWSPDFDATAIEASRYGATLGDAAANRLLEQARKLERSAAGSAALVLQAALADLHAVAQPLIAQLASIINQDGEFLSVTAALSHLMYLYQFDEATNARGRDDVGGLLSTAFNRGVWLLETLGQMIDPDGTMVRGVSRLLDTFERCETSLSLNRVEFLGVLSRTAHDRSQGAAVRGAAIGALWVLGETDAASVKRAMKLFADPGLLGDFLTGLFAIAREVVQRQRDLILAIDEVLSGYVDEDFLNALPSLRLAFTYFTPREKHYLATTLTDSMKLKDEPPLTQLQVSPEIAALSMRQEAALFAALKRYGVRGGDL